MGICQPFNVGDVVRLNSGGPHMTVRHVENDFVEVMWFGAHDSINEHVFIFEMLTRVTEKG